MSLPFKYKLDYIWKVVYIVLITLVFYLIISKWFRNILYENLTVALVVLLNSIFVTIYFLDYKKIFAKLIIISFGLLLILQVRTTNIRNTYSFTPSEIDMQITRMNYYPPRLAKIGYILEYKKEIKISERFIENFIEVVDFSEYFPDYFSFLSLPLFFGGLFWFIKISLMKDFKDKLKNVGKLLLLSVFALSVFGNNGKYGPFLIFPYIYIFIFIGVSKLLKKDILYEK